MSAKIQITGLIDRSTNYAFYVNKQIENVQNYSIDESCIRQK